LPYIIYPLILTIGVRIDIIVAGIRIYNIKDSNEGVGDD
jgi:hypothetical protein